MRDNKHQDQDQQQLIHENAKYENDKNKNETKIENNNDNNNENDKNSSGIPIISDPSILLQYGICKVPLPNDFDAMKWATEYSQMTPEILLGQGDDEYAFYRNIMMEQQNDNDNNDDNNNNDNENSFPLHSFVQPQTDIGKAILRYFPISNLQEEIRLDDAFCVHYNEQQTDTSGAKHMDPSDITINMCLEKTNDTKGSHVLFYGTKSLILTESTLLSSSSSSDNNKESETMTLVNETEKDKNNNNDSKINNKKNGIHNHDENNHQNHDGERNNKTLVSLTSTQFSAPPEKFLVLQEPGYATIHYGDHFHETTFLEQGRRTNIILTYCYTDPTRSDVATRTCY